jgi:hypothetical protein
MYHITTAKDISGYTMYYKEVIKLYKIRMIYFLESLKPLFAISLCIYLY